MSSVQEIKNRDFFISLCDQYVKKEDEQLLEQIENIVKENKINPCRLKMFHNFSLMNVVIISEKKKLFNSLVKYSNDNETPEELTSVWSSVAYVGKEHYFNALKKQGYVDKIKNNNNNSPIGGFINYLSKKKIDKPSDFFEDKKIKFYLENGANINTSCEDFVNYPIKLLYFLLEKKISFINNNYLDFISGAIEYGFDINSIYNINKETDFIYNFCEKIKSETESQRIINYIDFYVDLMIKCDYNFENTNNKGETLIELINKNKDSYLKRKVNALYEKNKLQESFNYNEEKFKVKRI